LIETGMRRDAVVLTGPAIAGIAAALLMMGVVVSGYGPLLEHLTRRFGVSLPVAGSTISVQFFGALAGVLIAMGSTERYRARLTTAASCAIAAAGVTGVALAPSWPLFLTSVFIFGVGFGGLDLVLNQVVAYSEGRRRAALLNALNSAYPAGAVIGPLLIAAFAATHFAALFLLVAAAFLLIVPAMLLIAGRLPVAAAATRRPEGLVMIFVAGFVLYVGLEVGTGGWMTSHLESTGMASGTAATVTSGFWLALVTGRLLITLVPTHLGEPMIVLVASAAATVAVGLATITAMAPVAYIAAGLAMAPIFPTGIVWLARLRPGDSRATAWLYPAASAGGVMGPGAIGIVIAQAGVLWAPAVLAIVGASMYGAFVAASRR
jgi:fucose permease